MEDQDELNSDKTSLVPYGLQRDVALGVSLLLHLPARCPIVQEHHREHENIYATFVFFLL